MTEKELRRLSRLEVLELLLEQTKENERLRQEFEQLKNESATESETEKLYKLSLQLNSALSRVNEITNELKSNICKADPPLNSSVNLQTASPLHGETETPQQLQIIILHLKTIGKLIMMSGVIFILATFCLTLYNNNADSRAGKLSAEIISKLNEESTTTAEIFDEHTPPDYTVTNLWERFQFPP